MKKKRQTSLERGKDEAGNEGKWKSRQIQQQSRASSRGAAALEGTAPRARHGHSATIHQEAHHIISHTADIIITLS